MKESEVLAKIDLSSTGEISHSEIFEGIHAQPAQLAVTNMLAKMVRTGTLRRGKDADGNTVYSRLTDAEKAARAEREAAKEQRRAEIAAEKAAKKGGA